MGQEYGKWNTYIMYEQKNNIYYYKRRRKWMLTTTARCVKNEANVNT